MSDHQKDEENGMVNAMLEADILHFKTRASEAEGEVVQLKAELASIGKVAAIGLKKSNPYDMKTSLLAIEMAVASYNE